MTADITKDDRILIDGELVSVAAVTATPSGFECIVKSPTQGLFEVFIRPSEVADHKLAASDGTGDSGRAITAVCAKWMEWAILPVLPGNDFLDRETLVGFSELVGSCHLPLLCSGPAGADLLPSGPEHGRRWGQGAAEGRARTGAEAQPGSAQSALVG